MSRATISITVLGVASLSVVLYLLQLSAKELTALGLPLVLLKSIVAFGTTIFALSARSYRQNLLLVQLFFLSLLLHFPGNLTFHWDEWDLLYRYADQGFESVLNAHGAHVIPLATLNFILQGELTNFWYPGMLLFSAFVIAVHGRLLADLMLTLKLEQDFDLRAITLVPVLFVLSAFQLEGAQWSFIQCVLLQNICGLVAAIYAVRWLGDCKNSNLYKSLVAVAVAPLFQATGFINPAFVILILIFAGRYRHTLTLKTLLFYIALAAIALIPSLITYWAFALPSPGTSAFADFLAEPRKFFPYVLSFFLHGIFAVTFMRGLSLFPSLLQEDLRAAHWMHTLGVEQLYFSNGHESVVITFGIIVFAALAVLLLLERRRTLNFKLLLLGSFVMTLFFILPAMGRYTFGIPASLYLRYQTRELIGLLLILLPLLSFYLFEARKIVKVMAWLALSYHFFIQTKMSTTNPYFAEKTIRVMEVICRLETEKSRHLLQTGIKNAISNDWEYSPERLRYVLTHYELGCKHELDS